MNEQLTALQLADWLDNECDASYYDAETAAELRRLHEENERLRGIVPKFLEDINDKLCADNAELLWALRKIAAETDDEHSAETALAAIAKAEGTK